MANASTHKFKWKIFAAGMAAVGGGGATHLSDLVGQQFADYRMDEIITMGNSGMVFRGVDTKHNRKIAMKVLASRGERPLRFFGHDPRYRDRGATPEDDQDTLDALFKHGCDSYCTAPPARYPRRAGRRRLAPSTGP